MKHVPGRCLRAAVLEAAQLSLDRMTSKPCVWRASWLSSTGWVDRQACAAWVAHFACAAARSLTDHCAGPGCINLAELLPHTRWLKKRVLLPTT